MAYRATTLVQNAGPRSLDFVDQAIRDMLGEGRARLALQPVVPVAAGSRPDAWVELLIRPSHEGLSLPAGAVIDRAAELGLARPLDLLVLGMGLEWLAAAPEVELCSINVSGQSVSNPAFLGEVLDLIRATGVAPSRICLEVTETVPIANFGAARNFAASLRAAGCHMALDDFGTGSSNLLMLVPMEMDFLKIDGRFIRHMPERTDYTNLVRGIVAFAESVGLRTVAECVESQAQFDCACDMGVNFIQGYYREGAPRVVETTVMRAPAWETSPLENGAAGAGNGIRTTGD